MKELDGNGVGNPLLLMGGTPNAIVYSSKMDRGPLVCGTVMKLLITVVKIEVNVLYL